jgi:hypothetical protein
MTQPTVIYFGPDGGPVTEKRPGLKIYLRTLLYATSKRGCVVESMFARLRRGETSQNFNIWVYGEEKLSRGSGLFIPESGIAANHHFLLPSDGTSFEFMSGQYCVEVFASIVRERRSRRLYSAYLDVSAEQAAALKEPGEGLYFDWGPDAARYHGHIKAQPKLELPQFLRELLVSAPEDD